MSFKEHVEESRDQDAHLDNPGSNKEIEADGCPAVCLQKNHQESEADEDHDMHILEDRIVCLDHCLRGQFLSHRGTCCRMYTCVILRDQQEKNDHNQLPKKVQK